MKYICIRICLPSIYQLMRRYCLQPMISPFLSVCPSVCVCLFFSQAPLSISSLSLSLFPIHKTTYYSHQLCPKSTDKHTHIYIYMRTRLHIPTPPPFNLCQSRLDFQNPHPEGKEKTPKFQHKERGEKENKTSFPQFPPFHFPFLPLAHVCIAAINTIQTDSTPSQRKTVVVAAAA